MYHNPEKPFACDICHKRFHAIFKVWTHCRTQHGVAKNPAPAASSHAVLDEKFQRKLLDTVREREIKQALILKLRRGRPGFHGPGGPPAQVLKRGLRSRAKGGRAAQGARGHPGLTSTARPPALPGPLSRPSLARDDPAGGGRGPEPVNFDSEDSTCLPEDLSLSKPLKIQVKEEPAEEAEEQKCGKTFPAPKQLERHQELLCSVKPFTCHVCNKAFRTNFRLWSHFQPHMAQASEDRVHRDPEAGPGPAGSPSQPPLPPPLPKIQPLEPNSPTGLPETPTPTADKLFAP
ncbi:hypothetical protein MJG53_003744 [Ovis ammon polii x Ovis aries]|uniref:Uncharacterized protein n=1 Tax=Ovis ammon polii x Ovis aries TaxID=2918886 RepID=A0ACB9VH55_9CETA|nr:hypothetical protein MJG53_003744 [Ovis ammon polii x Ovis aries]